ncbi:MAG: hypothetical protein AVDCRST_MAG08-1791 [uncultured Acetobacteraceae bacterium]|uniref:Uncharacterized protein n=1 Tax=uncultured Acetobacteraceae bacterium TaxID=169975 RepID=A0A6J4I7I2_9PROT|nr:MAG: hypothetical protein AVDCRST_MAG08-1791 [uncultured Acetobacteraceae bacterium]
MSLQPLWPVEEEQGAHPRRAEAPEDLGATFRVRVEFVAGEVGHGDARLRTARRLDHLAQVIERPSPSRAPGGPVRRRRHRHHRVRQARPLQSLQRVPGAARLPADHHPRVALGAQLGQGRLHPGGGGVGVVGRRGPVEAQHVVAGVVEDADVRLRLPAAAVLPAGGPAVRPKVCAAGRARPLPQEAPVRRQRPTRPGGQQLLPHRGRAALAPGPDHLEVAGVDPAALAAPAGADFDGARFRRLRCVEGGGPAPGAVRAEGEGPRRRLLQEAPVVLAAGHGEEGRGVGVEHRGPRGRRRLGPPRGREGGEEGGAAGK